MRVDGFVVGESTATGAGSGAYTTTPNGRRRGALRGTFGLGVRTAGPGEVEANLNGVQPLIDHFQRLK